MAQILCILVISCPSGFEPQIRKILARTVTIVTILPQLRPIFIARQHQDPTQSTYHVLHCDMATRGEAKAKS